jgi:ABC-type sugar transport system substrate-binding protein
VTEYLDLEDLSRRGPSHARASANMAFVGYDPDVIGRCAADYVGEHARRSRISAPRVLVIGSNKLHLGRHEEFAKRLRLRLQDAEVIIDDGGDFDRTRAREIVYKNLRSGQRVVPNYIFCTNDEMTLGAVDAHADDVVPGVPAPRGSPE